MRKFSVLLMMAAVLLCVGGGAALAADKAEVLKQGAEKMEALICESEGKALMQNVGLFKQAGLSYQPSLVVPLKGAWGCKDQKQLGMLMGAYAFDANYALLFGKKKEFAATNQLLAKDISNRLKMNGKIKITTFTPEELKKIAANPNDPANRELQIKYTIANLHASIQVAQTDAEFTGILVDSFYGATMEGLYVASKLALSAGAGDKLLALFNEQAKRLDKTQQILEAYAGNAELLEMLGGGKRQAVLKSALELLKAKSGKLAKDDVKKLLALVEPERAAMVKVCK
jgi:hypothetical protein